MVIKHCLHLPILVIALTTVESTEAQPPIDIPRDYHNFEGL